MSRALWDSGYTMHLEVAFSATTGDSGAWDSAIWDTSTWGPDRVWTDVAGDLFSWSSMLGRNRETGACSAATGGVTLDNLSGDYTPENLSGAYVTGGITGVRPGRPIRGYATRDSDGAIRPLFYGTIDDWDEDLNVKVPRITFAWVDGIADLAAVDGYEQSSAGEGELAGPRLHRVLDNAEWDGDRNIDLGDATMQGTTLAQAAWTEVVLTADSEGGEVWIDPDNTFTFQDRLAPLRNTRSNTVQWTLTDADTPGALHYDHVQLANGMDVVVNEAAIARAGGTVQVVTDQVSKALYKLRRWGRNDLICENDDQAYLIAATTVARRADPTRRPRSVTLRPRVNPGLWAVVMEARRMDRITVTRQHEPTGTEISHDCLIDGIEHAADDKDWVTVLRLASTAGIPPASEFGEWDGTLLWDEAVWGV